MNAPCRVKVRQPSRLRSAAALAAAAFLALGSGVAGAVETTFVGYTDGCFGLACVPPSVIPPQSTSLGGLTYDNSTFNVTTVLGAISIGNGPGVPNTENLGSFTLTGSLFDYTGSNFDLRVTFTAPSGTTPDSQVISDVITGAVTSDHHGGVHIDFDNILPKHFTFDNGSFDLYVNDFDVTAGHDIALSGRIVTSVPEPETYALFMAGLAAVGFMARRRKA